MNYPEFFKDRGFDLNNTWIEFYEFKIDSTGLIEDSVLSYTKMLGGK
jgi:hypothetical protein